VLSDCSNVRVHPVQGGVNEPSTLLWPTRLGPSAADVFHSPHNILGRGFRCATVVTVHDVMWIEEPHLADGSRASRWVRSSFFRRGILHALDHATRIVTVSNASRDAIVRLRPALRHRVVVTYNAAGPEFVPPADASGAQHRAAVVSGSPAPYFLLVGQHAPSKGHGLALEAFAPLASSHRLVVVHRTGPRGTLARRARQLGIASRVTFLEVVDQADLIALFQSATALLQPSLAEGFGLPALEAMACGCPVIASDIAPLREVVGDAGLFGTKGDAAALARALGRLVDDSVLRSELGARGLARAAMFSWDECARDTLEVYREAAAAGPCGP
jgi:glycosyltransferase involved in cell wall biosynthesis